MVAGWMAGYLSFAAPFYVVGTLSVVAAWAVWRFARESIGPGGVVLEEEAAYAGRV